MLRFAGTFVCGWWAWRLVSRWVMWGALVRHAWGKWGPHALERGVHKILHLKVEFVNGFPIPVVTYKNLPWCRMCVLRKALDDAMRDAYFESLRRFRKPAGRSVTGD